MKHGLCKGIVALFLMAAMLVGASALAEGVIDEGLTDAQEVVKEVGEVDLYAPVVYAGTEQADAGEKDEQSAMEHNAEYYYEINSTFPDAVFRQYIRQYYDWDGDGYLSDEECLDVTSLYVNNMGIKSLDGISVFENLERLYCHENNIEQLDVSYNENLEILWCQFNQIASLWLPQNGNLEELFCYNNQLTWLDLSQNTFLHKMWMEHNKIESIDIYGCSDLISVMDERMGVSDDGTVNWGDDEVLFSADKDIYIYSSNDLLYTPLVVEIDSTHFPADDFRDYVLEECDTNEDEWLDVDEIASVTDITLRTYDDVSEDRNELYCPNLDGIEFFTNLVILQCPGCNVESLDLTKNKDLIQINCYKNNINKINLSKNKELIYVDFDENKLTSLNIKNNTKLINMFCSNNKLKKLDIGKNKKLEYLVCSGNKLKTLDISNNTLLKTINCEDNNLKSMKFGKNKQLVNLYAKSNSIKSIDIKNCTKLQKLMKQKREYTDGYVWWYKLDFGLIEIDKKTKVTAGSKVLYAGK